MFKQDNLLLLSDMFEMCPNNNIPIEFRFSRLRRHTAASSGTDPAQVLQRPARVPHAMNKRWRPLMCEWSFFSFAAAQLAVARSSSVQHICMPGKPARTPNWLRVTLHTLRILPPRLGSIASPPKHPQELRECLNSGIPTLAR